MIFLFNLISSRRSGMETQRGKWSHWEQGKYLQPTIQLKRDMGEKITSSSVDRSIRGGGPRLLEKEGVEIRVMNNYIHLQRGGVTMSKNRKIETIL